MRFSYSMRKVGAFTFVLMLLFSFAFVLAQDNDSDSDEDNDSDDLNRSDGLRKRIRSGIFVLREQYRSEIDDLKVLYRDDLVGIRAAAKELISTLNDSNLTEDERQGILEELRDFGAERRELRTEFRDDAQGIRVEYRSELRDFFNESRTEYRLRNGRNVQVKIMPEVASPRAIERLQLKVCNESNNCSIEFKEVGSGNNTRLVYSLKAKKEGRFLGLFRTRMDVDAEVDAETGDVIRSRKPWWAFLVNE